jgi:hypothetical protein
MKVIEGGFGRQPCANLAADLREMADAVERGELVDLVACYTQNGEYQTLYAASLESSVFLATLLHRRSIDRCIEG